MQVMLQLGQQGGALGWLQHTLDWILQQQQQSTAVCLQHSWG